MLLEKVTIFWWAWTALHNDMKLLKLSLRQDCRGYFSHHKSLAYRPRIMGMLFSIAHVSVLPCLDIALHLSSSIRKLS